MPLDPVCAVGHRDPGKRQFRRRTYGKGFGYSIPFNRSGRSIERTSVAGCTSNETHTAGAETGPADTL